MKDWPLLEQAIDQKIEEQAEFVQWWDDSVRGKGKKANNADLGYFVEQAEAATEITQQQVSRWRKRLQDAPTYRAKLYGKAWTEAFGVGSKAHVANNSGENEWYTPAQLVMEALEEVTLEQLAPRLNFSKQTISNFRPPDIAVLLG